MQNESTVEASTEPTLKQVVADLKGIWIYTKPLNCLQIA